MKKAFETTPSDSALRAEEGWMDMDVRWLLTRDTVGAEHSVFGITVFPPGAKHDIHRHPNAEEFEYLVSGHGIARVGDADVELGPGEVVFVPTNDYHGFENTGDEPAFMIWGYAGAASLVEAGYIRYVDEHPSAAARARDRRRRRLRCSACLDHNVEPLAAAELEQQLGEIHAGRIRSLRRAESRCRRETLRVDVHRNDPSRDGAA